MRELKVKAILEAVALRNLIWVFVVGFVVGLLVHLISPNKKGMGFDIFMGILGAFLLTVLLTAARGAPVVDRGGAFIVELLGALLFIGIGRLLK